MIRRKIRPLSVLAFVAVLLLFQFLRRGGKEVFSLDTLPPYTDTDDYVKKPVPPQVPKTLPPPPPADWFRDHQDVLEESRVRPQTPNGRVNGPAPPAPKNPPQRADSEQQRTAYDDSPPRLSPSHEDEHQHSPATPPDTHHEDDHAMPNQPPAPGDVHTGGSRQPTRPLYSADDLAPRVVRNPIPPNSLINLPKIKPVTFPKVQARYPAESAEHKRIRLQRQSAIKRAMIRSWEAYSTYAMGHDEVRPVSGRYNDPFCGWGATLVDSLDTLQIMGMQAEYEAALEYIQRIDFSHTTSYSIPLFETVIRYLGGLLGAYDVSNGKDTILLDKAKDLADMLMGSFDTINRMPLLRYDWRPQSALVGKRASQDACLAEIGTLTLEFTRLAQLTGNDTYYDAVQRITDEFEDFQFSHIPGLFPLHVDASGCRHHEVEAQPTLNDQLNTESHYGQSTGGQQAHHQKRQLNEHTHVQDESHLEDPGRANMGNAMRESLSDTTRQPAGQPQSSWQAPATNPIEICERQGFTPSLYRSTQEFSMGGEADSTYEYFIKEHLLLGGAKDQYKDLYIKSVEAAEKYLFFQPLAEGDPDILMSGKYTTFYKDDGTQGEGLLAGEMQHLTCFVGGMLGLGSKIFNRPHDLVLAEKMTDGCVWAYNATASGVMAESFTVDVCFDTPCHWTPPPTLAASLDHSDPPTLYDADDIVPVDVTPAIDGETHTNTHVKRQLEPAQRPVAQGDTHHHEESRQGGQSRQGPPLPEPPSRGPNDPIEDIQHNAMGSVDPEVQQIALDRQHATISERILPPPSFHPNMDSRYILRPEAIESVFYMWRITGDPVWQDKGWQMWESIEKASWTELAYSAITNVNMANSQAADSMESFWLAETLKYFYLLYSDPSLISLDEWVFNTEAHPFKRPNPAMR